MPSVNRWGKKFNFKTNDIDWILMDLGIRDKIKYPTEGDYVADALRTFKKSDGILGNEDFDMTHELNRICSGKELIQSGGYFVRARVGRV